MKSPMIAIVVSLMCLFTAAAQAQNIVSVNFCKNVPMNPAAQAGAETARAAHWNNLEVKRDTESQVSPVMNQAGKVVSKLVISVFGGSTPGNTATFDQKGETLLNDAALFNGAYDQDEGMPTRIAATGIPFAKYDVYIYRLTQEVDSAERVGKFQIGKTTYYLRGGANEPNDNGSGYIRSTTQTFSSAQDITQGNYVKFEGLTGPSFTAEISAADTGGQVQRCKIAGFQIVERK